MKIEATIGPINPTNWDCYYDRSASVNTHRRIAAEVKLGHSRAIWEHADLAGSPLMDELHQRLHKTSRDSLRTVKVRVEERAR